MEAATTHKARLTLQIDAQSYVVRPLPRDRMAAGVRRGFILTRTDRKGKRISHTLTSGTGPTTCSCPDSTFHASGRAECKHLAAARACGLV